MISRILFFLQLPFLLALSGCYKKSGTEKISNEFVEESQAKLDVPVPLGTKFISSNKQANSYVFSCDDSIENIVNFYQMEMELIGWKQKAVFNDFESLLIFEKPHKISVISIRPEHKKNKIFIFLPF